MHHLLKKPLLKDNIRELLALGAVVQFLIVNLLVLFHKVASQDATTTIILTSSTNIVVIVLSFYFGSSQSSKDKQKELSLLNEKINVKSNEEDPTI